MQTMSEMKSKGFSKKKKGLAEGWRMPLVRIPEHLGEEGRNEVSSFAQEVFQLLNLSSN